MATTKEVEIIPNEIKDCFKCPIGRDYMVSPVILSCGHTFDQVPISQWFFQYGHTKCPICQQSVANVTLTPNLIMKNMIDEYMNNRLFVAKDDRDRFLERRVKAQQEVLIQTNQVDTTMGSTSSTSSSSPASIATTASASPPATVSSTRATPVTVVWYWKDGAYWHVYGKYTTSVIELALAQNRNIVNLPGSNNTYAIDLSSMKQFNRYSGYARDVRRFICTGSSVQWEWQADDASWVSFSPHVSLQLEGSHQLNLSQIVVTTINNGNYNFSYVMDTVNMVQTNSQTGAQRNLRRVTLQP